MPRLVRVWSCAFAALIAAAPPAAAELAPAAKPVVERYLAAIGGRAAWENIRSQRTVASISAFGLKGTMRSWSERPDRSASEIALGPFKLISGSNGPKAWRSDPSGKANVLDGKDLEDAVANTWFENEQWLTAGEGGGKIAFAGEAKDSLGAYDVLEVTPPKGRARSLHFDKKTGLLAKTVAQNDRQTMIGRSSDWREVNGQKIAFRLVQEVEGMAMNTLTVSVDTVEFNVAIPASRFTLPEASNAPAFLKTPGAATIPVDYRAKHVWLKAAVNGGAPVDFLYDTGASVTVIDSAYAAELGIARQGSMQGQGAGAAGSASFGEIASLKLAGADGDGVEVKGVKVGILDVNSMLGPFFWRRCAGIVGYDVISRFVNEIDYDHGTIRLVDPKGFRYEGKGATLPITISGHVPVVKFKLDGAIEGEGRLDVGSSGSLDLHGPFWKKHDLKAKAGKTLEATGGGFGGTFTNYVARAKKLEVGPYAWSAPIVSFFGAETGALASEDYAGNFGNEVFDRFKLTIDYERREIHLEPGARFDTPFRFGGFGAQLVQRDGKIVVGQVLPGSPAAKAGLAVGDEIVSVNGKPPLELDLTGVEKLTEDAPVGTKIEIGFSRAGRVQKKTLKLADAI